MRQVVLVTAVNFNNSFMANIRERRRNKTNGRISVDLEDVCA